VHLDVSDPKTSVVQIEEVHLDVSDPEASVVLECALDAFIDNYAR